MTKQYQYERAYLCQTCKDTCACQQCGGTGMTTDYKTCPTCRGTRLCFVCCDVKAAARAMRGVISQHNR